MYVPHSEEDRARMLERLGLPSLDSLFDCIPEALRFKGDLPIPPALSEIELTSHLNELARQNRSASDTACFAGAGCYDHFVPAVVDAIASRSEYYTAYTPYQPEVSQGTLQVGFEFQTLLCELTGLDVANSSLYEGATAVAEAALMSQAVTGRSRRIVIGETVHPEYRSTLETYLAHQATEVVVVPANGGTIDIEALGRAIDDQTACVIAQSPNFFGQLEPVSDIGRLARDKGALLVQSFDPISLGILKNPAELGADIAVGEGQALGNPMCYGGPFLGLFACKEQYVRKMPGRIVGQTVDRHGKTCYVLTLQTREQHIRREKATSNICTNQGLLALRASVYLALLGPKGLKEVAELCWHKAHYAAATLAKVPGCRLFFSGPFFKEFVLELPVEAEPVVLRLADRGIFAGVPLGRWFAGLSRCLLIAVTEKRTRGEIDRLADELAQTINIASP